MCVGVGEDSRHGKDMLWGYVNMELHVHLGGE